MFAKFSFLIRTHAISSPQTQILRRTGMICLRNIGTRMGRRLEKYFLFCNTAFLSLFTIKFVRYNIYDNIHSKLEQKKPANYIVNFRYILEVFDIYIYDKIRSKLEQKKPTKYIVNFR